MVDKGGKLLFYGDASTFIEAGVPLNGILLPRWNDQEEEGKIAEWLKHEGDAFRAGEPLVKIATREGSETILAPHPGTLWRITQAEGSVVLIGALLGLERPRVLPQDSHQGRSLILPVLYMVALLVMGVLVYLLVLPH